MLKRLLKTITRPIALGVMGLALMATTTNAQSLSSVYTSYVSSGSYSPITGGLSLGSATSDDQMYFDSAASALGGSTTNSPIGPGIPIGFNFNFKGVIYDRLGVNTNGWIALGQSSLGSSAVDMSMQYGSMYFYQPISTGFGTQATQLQNRIVALGVDLGSQTGASIRVQTLGTAPYRTCVIQWEKYGQWGSSGEDYNFQIILNETSNIVDIVYGNFTVGSTGFPQVGLLSGSDFMNQSTYDPSFGTYGDWTTGTATGIYNWQDNELSGSYAPASGLTYSWAAPLATYNSSTATTASTVGILPGSTNQAIIALEVKTSGFRGALNVTNIDVSTNGSTSLSDIDNLKVYYTGTSPIFANTTQYGSTVASPAVSNVVTGNVTLAEGTNYFWVVYDISATATLGDVVDAQIASVTVGPTAYVPTVSSPAGNREIAAPMTFVSTTASSVTTTKVATSEVNARVLRMDVVTSSTGSPINVTSFDIATTGTTSLLDITNLRIWYTANSKTFAAVVPFGAAVASPAATQTIAGDTIPLVNDTNYFWVTYDIASGATLGDSVDAEFTAITVDGVSHTPTATTAAGRRAIRQAYCIPTYMYPNYACQYNYYGIQDVVTTGGSTNINATSNGCGAPNAYTNFPTQVVTVAKNSSFTISLNSQYGYMSYHIWIDYNQDGVFTNATELVAKLDYNYSTPRTTSITVPCSALLGKTVLRVRGDGFSNSGTPNACGSYYYGETEDYVIDILDAPTFYTSSTTIQSTGNVAPSATNRSVLRVPVTANGCAVGTATEFLFSTTGTTSTADVTAAKLYATGNSASFNTNKLLGTVSSPSGQFSFLVTDTLLGNIGDTNNYWLAYDMSAGAGVSNVIDATFDSVYATGAYHVPTVSNPSGNITVELPMTFTSATTVPVSIGAVGQGDASQAVVGIQVVTSSTGAPIALSSLDIATTGTSSLTDITNLKVWYTGHSKTFATTNQFGVTVATPAATQTVTGTQDLLNDTNYFWVSYDIAGGATIGNTVDAEVSSITVDAVAQIPTATTATGSRKIRQPYCLPTYMYPNYACQYNYYGIQDVVTTGGITNINATNNGCGAPDAYTNFPNQVVTVAKNSTFTISLNSLYGYMNYHIWIDYNQDGVFTNATELVATSNYNYSTPRTLNITVPCSALTGTTTLRVRGDGFGNSGTPSACGSYYYGETEDYVINILDKTTLYTSSTAIQQTGNVSPSATNRQVLRVPVTANGCTVGTATEFLFSTTGSTSTADIASAKLYTTGTSTVFNTNKLLGTVSSPSGQFTFSITDTLLGNIGDTNNYWLAYDINPGAGVSNVVDATFDSVYATGAYHVPTVSAPSGDILIELPMTFVSTTAVPVSIGAVGQGDAAQAAVGIQVVTSSTGAPISVTSLDIATTGTTSLSDITNLNVWYTGHSKNFAATNPFGSTIASPAATQTVTGSQALMNDTNYFWVTYDIAGGAVIGDTIDGEITSITIDAVAHTPTVTAPTGLRKVRQPYCLPTYMYPTYACNNAYYGIQDVVTTGGTTNINSTANGCGAPNAYTNFPNQILTIAKNHTFTISLNSLYGYMNYHIWIDYNQDGVFTNASELVASTTYNYSTPRTASITIPCSALTGTTVLRVRGDGFGNSGTPNACGSYYYGETEDYVINIMESPVTYTSSTAIQQTGSVAPSATDRAVLRIPVTALGCTVGTATEFLFSTTGTTSTADIASAKLYATGNTASFNTNKLLGTIASPSGQFMFSVTDTLLGNPGDTNNYWLAYDMTSGAGVSNVVDATFDSVYATGAYHVPTVSNPSGTILIETPMTFISTRAVRVSTGSVGQGDANQAVVGVRVITSSTGAPIALTSLDIATTGTTSLSDISNLKVWYTGHSNSFTAINPFGLTVASPAATQTVTGTQALMNDTNYFWVTYDIASGATLGDTVDAEVTSITVDAVAHTPTVTAPTGFRKIRAPYCLGSFIYPNYPCMYAYYGIQGVTTTGGSTNINNPSNGCGAPNAYSSFPNQVVTVNKNSSFTINFTDMYGYISYGVWIDYNQDGVFTNATELVANLDYDYSTPRSASITIPCSALTGTTLLRVRGDAFGNNGSPDACASYYYGETEDYVINILESPTVYASSSTIQQTGSVAPSASNRAVLRVPVIAAGCEVGTATDFVFSTTGTTSTSDIASAKLYATGNSPYFSTSKLLATVASPSGQFTFTVADTLLGNPGDTNNYWLAYDITSGAGVGNTIDATFDSVYATGAYHTPTVSSPSGDITVEIPMTFVSTTVVPVTTGKAGQGTSNNEVIGIQVVTSSTGAPIAVTSMDIATTGTTNLADVTNLQVYYTGNSSTFSAASPFGSPVVSPAATQTVTGSTALMNDTNYFWVTYSIDGAATIGDTLDAEVTSITVDATAQIPTATSAAGIRTIRKDYCYTPEYYGNGTCGNDYYITGVSTSGGTTNISNTSGCPVNSYNNGGNYVYYSDYSNKSVAVVKTTSFDLTINDPYGYDGYSIWIDYNQDGDFLAADGELVKSITQNYNSSRTVTITVPASALEGTTRMRIRSGDFSIPGNQCNATTYNGETEDYSITINPLPAPTTYVWNQTSAADFTVSSNWTPTRTTPLGNDVLEFTGGGSITVNNVPSQVVSKIVVDNATSVTLGASSAVTLNALDTLALTSGNIITGNNVTVALGLNANSVGLLTGTGVIDGKFSRWVSASTASYNFPLVVGSDNRAVNINFTTAPTAGGTISSQFVTGAPSTLGLPITAGAITADVIGQEGIWKLTSSGISGGNYTATINASNFGGVLVASDLILIKRSSTINPWTLNGTVVTTTGTNADPVLSNTGMSGFGEYAVAGASAVNPLPVELISFTGLADAKNAYLNWATANETNNKGFEVERSIDGINFTKVDFVKGAGTTTSIQNYALVDANAFVVAQSSVLYYRLKQVDFNGNHKYTNIVTVRSSKTDASKVTVSPNPFNTSFDLSVVAQADGLANITVLDVQGKVIATTTLNCVKGVNSQTISELANAYNGVYFVRFTLNGETSVTRLVKVN